MVQIILPPSKREHAEGDHRTKGQKSLKAKKGASRSPKKSDTAKSAAGVEVIKIGKSIKTIKSRYRRKLCEAVGRLYGEAQNLRSSPDTWEEFRTDARLWKARKAPKPNADILRAVINLAVPASDRASLYYRAVKPLFDSDVAADKVPAAILKGGGFQAMADKYAQTRREARSGDERGSGSEKPKKLKLKARFDIPDDELTELSEGDVLLQGMLKRSDGAKYELTILSAVNVN